MLVKLLYTAKTQFEEQVLVVDIKQSKQADWLTRQAGLLALFCASFKHSCFAETDILQNVMF
jgi:hypothetical protein